MWAQILDALRDRLLAADSTLEVHVGGSAEVPQSRRVTLMRGPGTTYAEFVESGRIEQTVYAECWAHADDPAVANTKLQALEQMVIETMQSAGPQRLLPHTDALARVTQIEPDGDAFRPSVGSRITLKMQLRHITDP